jgi:hypothetical protein
MKAAILEDSDWMEDAVATIVGLSRAQEFITADDLRREIRPAPVANWAGLAFSRARNLGLIESTSSTVSTSKSRKNGSLKTWTRATNQGVAA